MATTQYIGARYVPIIVGEWDKTRTYEPLMVVTYQGASYTSRQYVPAGIEITNESYWVLSANYNAQVEAYRQEVRAILPYDETPTEGSTKGVTSDGIKKAIDTAEQTNADAIANEVTRAKAAEQVNATAIANEVTRAKTAEQVNATAIANEVTRAKTVEQVNATAIAKLTDRNVVIIGDSYLQGIHAASASANGTPYSSEFVNMTGATVHTYANGGAGFTSQGTTAPYNGLTFSGMLDVIRNNFENPGDIDCVILQSGYNDVSVNGGATLKDAIVSCVSKARSIFTNARVMIVFTYLCGNTAANVQNLAPAYSQFVYGAHSASASLLTSVTLNFVVDTPSHDNIHPAQYVQNCLGRQIANAYLNNYYADYPSSTYNGVFHYDTNDNLIITANSTIKLPSSVSANSWIQIGNATKTFGRVYFQALAPSKTPFATVNMLIKKDGTLSINSPVALNANEYIYPLPYTISLFPANAE